MIKKICFITPSSVDYPYLNELMKADFMTNIGVEIITMNKPSLNLWINGFVVKLISAFEEKISSIIKPLYKIPLSTVPPQPDYATYHDTLFVPFVTFSTRHANTNGNQVLTIEVNQKAYSSIETLVWYPQGKVLKLESKLNNKTPVLTYETSNNGPLVTQRIKNLNAVMHDLLYYSIKKTLQQ